MRRPYFYELYTLLSFAVIVIMSGMDVFGSHSPVANVISFASGIAIPVIAGVGLRLAFSLVRGDRTYLRRIRRRSYVIDSVRFVVGSGAMITTYLWIKLLVPLLHPRLFDHELWVLDQALFFGLAPTIFLLDLFAGAPLEVVDFTYAKIFYVSTIVATAFFLSHPSRRIRLAYVNGHALLWLTGSWFYLLVPSLGPAYRFPDIWMVHSEYLRVTQTLQALLMQNYQNVLRDASGMEVTAPIRIVFGIGAFPSLHVGFQFFVFLWMRRLWTSGEVLFGIFVVTIFLGSMITGWHYLVDGLAGALIAWISWRIFWHTGRLGRWFRLARVTRAAR
ncbi:MAG TPA: phosphatase PAP2 family protein [Thermoanaerobaculia bacterium]